MSLSPRLRFEVYLLRPLRSFRAGVFCCPCGACAQIALLPLDISYATLRRICATVQRVCVWLFIQRFAFLCIGSCQYRPICRVRRHARRNAQWCACRAVCPRHMIGYLHFDAAAVCAGSFMLPGRLAANSLAPTTLKRILAARPAPHRPRIVCAGTPASLPSSYNSQSNAKLRQNTIALQKEVFRPDDEVRIR